MNQSQPNQLGYYAAQAVELAGMITKIAAKNLSIERNTEEEIIESLKVINRQTWLALQSIEKDLSERKDRKDMK